jgi:hypothetical protein
MAGQSRIKFNPVTKEIEIEGSEKFVKTYFDKLQAMLSGTQDAVAAVPVKEQAIKEKPVKKMRRSKKAQKVAKEEVVTVKGKRGKISKTVLALIQDSSEGITTTELEEKTGLKDRQIWAVISYAKKAGKIKQAKRGVYVGT